MSMELGSVRLSPNPASGTNAKPPGTADEPSADAAGGSFMALLANSIESANATRQAPAEPSPAASGDDRLPVPDPAHGQAHNFRTDAQNSETAAVGSLDLAAQPMGDGSTPAGILVAPGATQGDAPPQPHGVNGKSGRAQLVGKAWQPSSAQTAQGASAGALTVLSAATDPLASEVGDVASSAVGGHRGRRDAEAILSAKAVATRANDIRLEAEALATGRLNTQPLCAPDGFEPGLWLALNHAAGKPGQLARAADRPASGALTDLAASAAAGPWTEGARAGGDGASAVTYSQDAAASTPAAAVAEKVHYWVGRGVQNAQLQLDAFGGGSVEVRILVQGNEAQVEFRSDQPEARKMLQDSMAQLKDLLKGDGLELAGAFVGSSAHQGSGARERHASAPRGRVSLGIAEVPSPAAGTSPARAQGRTVDIFV